MEDTVVSGTLMLKTEIIVHNDQVLMNMWGAGTLYDNKGHIVTNAHVVSAYINVPGEGAPRWLYGKVIANFEGGEECEAEVLSVDVRNDVALLKIPERVIKSDNIPCVLSKDVPGRRAKFFVVGHPNVIPFVVLYGRVSRPSRPLSDFENIPKEDLFNHMDPAMEFLELGGVTAAPGLSGGPLSTEEGSVFGVLNAGIQGIAYGIPAAIIESALDRMFKRSQLGCDVFCHHDD